MMHKTGIQELGEAACASLLARHKAYYATGATRSVLFRKKQLKALKEAIKSHESELFDAMAADFRKPVFETLGTEVAYVIAEIDYALKHIETWAKPRKINATLLNFPAREYVQPEPFGVSLIIAPWNYPFNLAIAPLVAAIAAGNCAVIKPSELTVHTSAIIATIVEKTFEQDFVSVVQGGVETATNLLAQPWDLIFFTGSAPVGKIVMKAAAEHLTPLILELGGKSPCFVDETADLRVAAHRIAWGKFLNAGQTCVAADYLLVHKSVKNELIKQLETVLEKFYSENPQESPDFARIISDRHFDRLVGFLENADVVIGGEYDRKDRYIAPTVLDKVGWDDPVMQEEIFGPILPIVSYTDLDEAIRRVNALPKPLALYVFSEKHHTQNKVLDETSAGGCCVNDTVSHMANPGMPFGGVGTSGHGNYHGQAGFDAFSNLKAVTRRASWLDIPLRYPPYKGKLAWVRAAFKIS
ncbi:MAG: aldehyde dehydrogenase [Bacteroidia bacterium]